MNRAVCRFASSRSRVVALAVAAASVAVAAAPARAVTIDWVTVGDPGNTADTTGDPNPAGAVANAFQIMKFEWTNAQYVEFLNAVDPNGTNPNGIYTSVMGSDARGGITNTGTVNGSRYAFKVDMGDKPVNYVTWWDAARVANWLHNGAQTSGSTNSSASAPQNTGAYTVGTGTSGNAVVRNVGAQYWIPTQNEWYKAAYYKGGGTNAGYWDYATQSDTAPTAVTSGTTGIGSAGSTGNFANFNKGADWNGQDGNVTTVGTNGGPSAYGAFDMSGNVFEMNDLDGTAGPSRGRRGGNWNNNAFDLGSFSASTGGTSVESFIIGFRLASPVTVPEPATSWMALAGLACGGFAMLRRRTRA
jgi:sulfatase modifying factor 1